MAGYDERSHQPPMGWTLEDLEPIYVTELDALLYTTKRTNK